MDQRLLEAATTLTDLKNRLLEAAINGDVEALDALLAEDKNILWKVCSSSIAETPLHVASLLGHVNFVRKIMALMPIFVQVLKKEGFAPIHLAVVEGHLEVVKELLKKANSDLWLLKDKAGRTALHLAAIKGRVDIIHELLSNCSRQKAMELEAMDQVTALGETVLHLAVKNNNLEAFKVLFKASEKLKDHKERVNAKDNKGKTVIEIAKATNQQKVLEIMRPQSFIKRGRKYLEDIIKESWGTYFKDTSLLPVMASMIAAATFQAGLNPPSSISENGDRLDHRCIKAALTFGLKLCPTLRFYIFVVCNTLAFAASVVLIPFQQNITMVPILTMISLYSLFFAYLISLGSTSPDSSFFNFIAIVIAISTFLLFYKPLKVSLQLLFGKKTTNGETNSQGAAS